MEVGILIALLGIGLACFIALLDIDSHIKDILHDIGCIKLNLMKLDAIKTCDVESMHPSSILSDEKFGYYTEAFAKELNNTRNHSNNDYKAAMDAVNNLCDSVLNLSKKVNEHEEKLNEIYIEEE